MKKIKFVAIENMKIARGTTRSLRRVGLEKKTVLAPVLEHAEHKHLSMLLNNDIDKQH